MYYLINWMIFWQKLVLPYAIKFAKLVAGMNIATKGLDYLPGLLIFWLIDCLFSYTEVPPRYPSFVLKILFPVARYILASCDALLW
jgi:hypothetical protein